MDFDFEPEYTFRYTLEQFSNLNHGNVVLPEDLKTIFAKYTMPACAMEQPYNNKRNIRFYPAGKAHPSSLRPGFRKKTEVYSDINILSDLRHAFSSVVKGDDGTVAAITTLNQILIPATMIEEIAKLFFDTIIQSPKQMPEYLKVLFSFRNGMEQKIYLEFVKHAMETLANPVVLTDTPLESGTARTKKHYESTCMLVATLFVWPFDQDNVHKKPREYFQNIHRLREKLLHPIIAAASEDAENVKVLAGVWSIVSENIDNDAKKLLFREFLPLIKDIYDNKSFKLSVRLLLRDFLS